MSERPLCSKCFELDVCQVGAAGDEDQRMRVFLNGEGKCRRFIVNDNELLEVFPDYSGTFTSHDLPSDEIENITDPLNKALNLDIIEGDFISPIPLMDPEGLISYTVTSPECIISTIGPGDTGPEIPEEPRRTQVLNLTESKEAPVLPPDISSPDTVVFQADPTPFSLNEEKSSKPKRKRKGSRKEPVEKPIITPISDYIDLVEQSKVFKADWLQVGLSAAFTEINLGQNPPRFGTRAYKNYLRQVVLSAIDAYHDEGVQINKAQARYLSFAIQFCIIKWVRNCHSKS